MRHPPIPCAKSLKNLCPSNRVQACHGARLKPEVLAITVGGKNINEVTQLTIKEALDFFGKLQLTDREQVIGAQILKEINARLGFLNNVRP